MVATKDDYLKSMILGLKITENENLLSKFRKRCPIKRYFQVNLYQISNPVAELEHSKRNGEIFKVLGFHQGSIVAK